MTSTTLMLALDGAAGSRKHRLPRVRNFPIVTFTKVVLFTDRDGRARWREEAIPLPEGTPQALLSRVFPAGGYQLRHSPVGFRSQWHCTPQPQWVFILAGEMEIGLQDGSSRVFKPGRSEEHT